MARIGEDVLVINDYGLTRRDRTLKSGAVKSRYTVTIKSEPIIIGVDPRSLTKAPAEAIAKHLRQRIEGISAPASPRTIKARQVAAGAAGKPWVNRRYSGGRTGSTPPNQSDRLFNDSGRFAKSIAVGAIKDGWVINVAANRLDATTFGGGEAGLARMVEQLRQYVPEWGNARELAGVLSVRRTIGALVKKANERTVDLEIARMKAIMDRAQQVIGAINSLAG